MTILIPIPKGNLVFTRRTLEQALTKAKNHREKDLSETATTVWLSDPNDEWARVVQLRVDNPDGLHGCKS